MFGRSTAPSNPTASAAESRVHTRVPLRLPAIWAGLDSPDGELRGSPAEVENVGEGGVFLRGPMTREPGTRVHVWLAPDGMPAIALTGAVAWATTDGGMGIRIDDGGGPSVLAQLLCLS